MRLNGKNLTRPLCRVVVPLMIGGSGAAAFAAEIGHYGPALPRPRDFLMPQPGNYYLQYNTYYTADSYRDRRGHKTDTVTIGNRTVNIDVDVDSYMFIPAVAHVSETEILGGHYGFFVIQPFGNLSAGAALSTLTGRGISTDDSSFGLGDTYVQPVWLGWNFGDETAAISYGFDIPDGKYDVDDTSNVGLGFWTHQFQATYGHYFDPKKTAVLVTALTYEIHGNKEGVDIEPGDDLSFNLGFDKLFPIAEKWLGNASLAGYGEWQVSDDTGADATRGTIHDHVYGAGFSAGLTYLPWLGQVELRWMHEFDARDRLEGDYYMLNLGIPL